MADISTTKASAHREDDDPAGGIGRRLRAYRAARGMRVAELARAVGVTPSLISQIEHGQSRPSVSTLFALAQALDVPVDAFFREAPDVPAEPPPAAAERGAAAPPHTAPPGPPHTAPPGPPETAPPGPPELAQNAPSRGVVHPDGRAVIDIEGGVRWERLTRATLDHLDFIELVYPPGAQSHPRQYTHPGTEMVLVMSGLLEISVGFEHYRLRPGDSIDFPSSLPHRYANPWDETARAVTVIFYDCPGGAGRPPQARQVP
jgi:transcriptional regulator with XRE-family HTH domain/quercetin dioxygenase-like cupin family protein